MPRQSKRGTSAQKWTFKPHPKLSENGCKAFLRKSARFCGKTCVPGKKVCAGHGGLSTGPSSAEGIARICATKTIHGSDTRALRLLRSQISHKLRLKEEEMYAAGLIHGPRTRGRKPSLWAQTDGITEFFTKVS